MNKGNYLYLGIAASLFVIAIIQYTMERMLPISLYDSIAWVSLELAILELIKTVYTQIHTQRARRIKITQDEIDLCNKHISVMSKFETLKEDAKYYINFRESLMDIMEKLKKDKSVKQMGKVVNAISIAQIVFAFIMVTITSLKNVPNNFASNKTIGILSVLAFAFLILSYFFKNSIDPIYFELDYSSRDTIRLGNYYLDMLDKIAKKENCDGNK